MAKTIRGYNLVLRDNDRFLWVQEPLLGPLGEKGGFIYTPDRRRAALYDLSAAARALLLRANSGHYHDSDRFYIIPEWEESEVE